MKKCHRFRRTILIAVLLILGFLLGSDASAAGDNPCSEDIAKFCRNIKPGQAALMECLERHESQLSDACKEYEARMERPRAEAREVVAQQMMVRQACRTDVAKFCNDVKSESGGIAACLREHMSQLSMTCNDALAAARGGEEEKKAK